MHPSVILRVRCVYTHTPPHTPTLKMTKIFNVPVSFHRKKAYISNVIRLMGDYILMVHSLYKELKSILLTGVCGYKLEQTIYSLVRLTQTSHQNCTLRFYGQLCRLSSQIKNHCMDTGTSIVIICSSDLLAHILLCSITLLYPNF